jgi:DNA-binding LacI/PurR family transcriptional regulator
MKVKRYPNVRANVRVKSRAIVTNKTTLREVAERAGVSYQTVSKVLNGQKEASKETEERIMEVVRQLGYRPNQIARNMRVKRSHMIGYSWVPTGPNQVNHILDHFLSSMVMEAEAAGYHLLPFPFREGNAQVDAYRELITTGRVDAFVLSSVNYNDPRIHFLLEQKFPFVAFGRSNPELDFPYVDVDGASGLAQAVEHLVSKGQRKIAVIGWPEDSRVGNERLRGYFETMKAKGLQVRPEWIKRGEGTFEFGRTAAAQLLALRSTERPTAILTLNDTQAIGALQAAREIGLDVGRTFFIIGFDDAPMSQYLQPPLTTVRQPIGEAGRKCVEILIALMRGEEPLERRILLTPKLIIRNSA